MRAVLASTSANNFKRGIFSVDKSLLTKHRIWLIGIGAGIGLGIGVGAYYIWRRSSGGSNVQNAFLVWAEQKKAQGIDVYKDKRYQEAIQIFNDIVQSLYDEPSKLIGHAYDDLLAICENNIAACYDALLDSIRCIEHCTKAIQLKPDYAKALVRRARCLHRLERPLEALEDYMVLISLDQAVIHPQQVALIQNDIEKLMNEISEVECNKLLENRIGQRQKIPQSIVDSWQFCTSIHDPLLLRAAGLYEKASEGSLDDALVELKRCNYNEIVSLSTKAIENDQNDNIERAQAVLLAARFLHYHGLEEEAIAMADKFMTFWEQLDEGQKLANKDLHVAQIVLEMALERTQTDESEMNIGNGENMTTLNEAKILRLNQLVDEALRINPLNVDPLISLASTLLRTEQLEEALSAISKAKHLDKDHPFIKFVLNILEN
uniref:TPR_REGION domain-containing protein n=1 Tax=Meloidogyne hapla TaxID=6305 RepID=A0A1I8B818_MELHA